MPDFLHKSCQYEKKVNIKDMQIKELIGVEKRQQNPESQNLDKINLFTFNFLERIHWIR